MKLRLAKGPRATATDDTLRPDPGQYRARSVAQPGIRGAGGCESHRNQRAMLVGKDWRHTASWAAPATIAQGEQLPQSALSPNGVVTVARRSGDGPGPGDKSRPPA